jgi:hypothetical protein
MKDKEYRLNDPSLKKKSYDDIYNVFFGKYKLRNCPFCDKKPRKYGVRTMYGIEWVIQCLSCRIRFSYSKTHLGGFDSKKQLVNRWNGYK